MAIVYRQSSPTTHTLSAARCKAQGARQDTVLRYLYVPNTENFSPTSFLDYAGDPVEFIYHSKDYDMGLPNQYKLFKNLMLDIDLIATDIEAAEDRRASLLVSPGASWIWEITSYITVWCVVDGGNDILLGTYIIPIKGGSNPIFNYERHGQLRLIPPTAGAVMGRTIKFKIKLSCGVLRRLDLEYALRSNIPPTTTNVIVKY
jgi:hypothetical protein